MAPRDGVGSARSMCPSALGELDVWLAHCKLCDTGVRSSTVLGGQA